MRRMKPQWLKAFACSASAGITYFVEISHISKYNAAHEAAGAKYTEAVQQRATQIQVIHQAFSKNIAAQEAAAAKVTRTQRVSGQFIWD